jgi:hypothetical protein
MWLFKFSVRAEVCHLRKYWSKNHPGSSGFFGKFKTASVMNKTAPSVVNSPAARMSASEFQKATDSLPMYFPIQRPSKLSPLSSWGNSLIEIANRAAMNDNGV